MIRNKTRGRTALAMALSCVLASPLTTHAQTEGSVQVPLSEWQHMTSGGARAIPPAALGVANVSVDVRDEAGRIVATATATLTVRASAEGASAVLLPPGTAIDAATVDGEEITLVTTGEGLTWIADRAGAHHVSITYEIEGVRSEQGVSVALPLPPAPSVRVHASLPPEASDAAIVPAVGVRSARTGDAPTLDATVPGGGATQLAWRALGAAEIAAPSRATYHGVLSLSGTGQDAVRFDVALDVDLGSDAPVPITLFPIDVALGSVTVDNADAPIRVVDGHFAAIVSGHGRHTIRASIEVPIDGAAGLPSANIAIPEVPVSRFEIELPPGKDLRVSPTVAVSHERSRTGDLAVFHVPLTASVHLEWPEALPDEGASPGEVEVRTSATLVHVLRAEEGLLRGRVHAAWDVAHGSTSRFELSVPSGVDVSAVNVDVATVADWRVSEVHGSDPRTLSIFLDREVSGAVAMTIDFDVLRTESATPSTFEVPLLSADGVWRQTGMLAMLATHDLVLEPSDTGTAARVGENQLPAEIRSEIDATIAHVFRWTTASVDQGPPHVSAAIHPRPHEDARFDARVDTLVTLGDVSTTASAAFDVHVKSGTLTELSISLPEGASVLEVSAPSLREHRVEDGSGHPVVHLWFTQEMEGDVRVELRWERMGAAGETDVSAPIAHIENVDVEQGRIAIEATAAVEVSARDAQGLSPMDVGELPEDLVLRSASPILLAFRYAHATPAPSLALAVARHAELTLRDASIDEATYRTLVTNDGLAVTTVSWMVRNLGLQFLRIGLPRGADVWTARVNGRTETPALASEEGATPEILVTVPRSAEPFLVELTYATPVARVGLLGRISVELPRPDLLVSHASWEVNLPADARWSTPASDLALSDQGVYSAAQGGYEAFASASSGAGPVIRIPSETMRFVFDDVLVGESGGSVGASFPYASGWGVAIGWLLGLLGALAAWLGVLGLFMARTSTMMVPEGGPFELATYRFANAARHVAVTRRGLSSLAIVTLGGLALTFFAVSWLGASPLGPIAASLAVLAGLLVSLRKKIVTQLSALRLRLAPPAPIVTPPPSDTPTPEAS